MKMGKKFLAVNWRVVEGAAKQKKMLRLRPDEDGCFVCPVESCMHVGFKSSRGLRKHIDTRHNWYYYFDTKPAVKRDQIVADPTKVRSKCLTHTIPSFSLEEGIGLDFCNWLQAPLGGGKTAREAGQIAKRGMKFLLHVMGEDFVADTQACADYIDCAVGSAAAVIKFMETITTEWGMSSSGAVNYVKSISDLADFRKSQGISDTVLRAFSVTEVYLRRGKENLQRKKSVEYSRNLDLESLIIKDSWCTLEEMEKVIPFHAQRYKDVFDKCSDAEAVVTVNDLAFASRFVATYLFLRVKCSRPKTFQYITLQMVENAKKNGGFIDQTEFKTADKYVFDTVIMNEEIFKVLDMYICRIRPKMHPTCNYLVVSNTGRQYNSFTTAMTVLVKQAIGKYVHPTRLRQIVETTSSTRLSTAEQEIVTADQKHASGVAQRSYKKRLSREVATQGKECMAKMLGSTRDETTEELAKILRSTESSVGTLDERVIAKTRDILGGGSSLSVGLRNDSASSTGIAGSNSSDASDQSMPGEEEMDDNPITTHLNLPLSSASVEVEVTATVPGSLPYDSTKVEDGLGLPTWPDTSSSPLEVEVTGTVPGTVTYDPTKVEAAVVLPTWPETSQAIIDVKEEEQVTSRLRERKCTVKFSREEDDYLIAGVKKYGVGHWGKIRGDTAYKFDKGRTRDSLRVRYGSAEIKRKLKAK